MNILFVPFLAGFVQAHLITNNRKSIIHDTSLSCSSTSTNRKGIVAIEVFLLAAFSTIALFPSVLSFVLAGRTLVVHLEDCSPVLLRY